MVLKVTSFSGEKPDPPPDKGARWVVQCVDCQVIEKDSPQPQVEVAFGLTKTNPLPCSPS